MKNFRINAVMAGVLYVIGTAFGITGAIVGGDVYTSLVSGKSLIGIDILSLVGSNTSQLLGGAFFTLLMGISLAAMTIFLYPIFRKDSEELAMGMVIFRGAIEGVWYMITTLSFLALGLLGNEYVAVGANSSELQSVGNVVYRFLDVIGPVGVIMFLIGATCIYISFYRTKLIPRWLTIWGFIGIVPFLAYAILHFFQLDNGIGFYLQMVLAPQELVMGLWLIIKGFDQEAVKELIQAKNII